MTKKTFKLNGRMFIAENCVAGVLINPVLPKDFDNTANEERPASHGKFVGLPYIETISDVDNDPANDTDEYADKRRANWAESGRDAWFKAWPSGIRYDVRCLDGGAWDRPTYWGGFATLEQALECAGVGPAWRNNV
jgi:hypothetical protein